MPIFQAPRSVVDATRFTSYTPHASSKASTISAASRFAPPSLKRLAAKKPPPPPPPSSSPVGHVDPRHGNHIGGATATSDAMSSTLNTAAAPTEGIVETPEQRVARLRAAHLAARNAEFSRFDRLVEWSRKWCDSAHKVTVLSLIGFTVIATCVSVYTVVDMVRYNRKRKAEFLEAQRRMEADSLEAARLAYMTGKATEEQIALVEEANERLPSGRPGILSQVLNVSSQPVEKPSEDLAERSAMPIQAPEPEQTPGVPSTAGQAKGWRIPSFLSFSLSAVLPRLKESAKASLEIERQNQQKGGLLDRIGETPVPADQEPKDDGHDQ